MTKTKKTQPPTDLAWLAAVIAIVCGVVCVLVFTPAATIGKLFEVLGRLPESALSAIAVAVAGAAVAIIRNRSGGPPAPPALPMLPMLACVLVATCSGCGASAYRAQYTAIDAAAELTAGASEVVYAATAADIHEGCAATLAPPDFAACASAIGASWQPAQTAIGSLRLGLGGWYEGTRIAEVHGASLGDVALQGAAALVRAYVALADLLGPEHPLPPLPDVVIAIARGLGGER